MRPDALSHKRAAVYQWFSQLLYRELTDEQLQTLCHREHGQWMASLAALPGLPENVATFERRREYVLARKARQQELAADYAMLFLIGPPSGVSPYEGHYPHTSPARARQDMRRLLAQRQQAPGNNEEADHVAIQLALMARLIEDNTDRETQHHFVHAHLMSWLPLFSDCCAERDETGFYAAAVKLITSFVALDEAWLVCGD